MSSEKPRDKALTRKMMADLEVKYCVDKGLSFATGFSYGGSMSTPRHAT